MEQESKKILKWHLSITNLLQTKEIQLLKIIIQVLKITQECALGICYENGEGIYENGEGIEKDLKMALKYYKMSADQGNSSGQISITNLLQTKVLQLLNITQVSVIRMEKELKKILKWHFLKWHLSITNLLQTKVIQVLKITQECAMRMEKELKKILKWHQNTIK
eukprot:TRINITY_DN519_c0_g1_i33.p3 TRINITY_DN519_c0_g1~~TRINITY_DN519_c0_g1_i33.p3  ORF type:complete len:165 (+),score=21.96 TRINITY_DN519_c0_g1_i33:195-689(+)